MITIVDYGSGNIKAITNIFEILKISYSLASTPAQLNIANKIILPGVGSFDHCMNKLIDSGLKNTLHKKVIEDNTPVLGICIGLHLMANSSEEGNLNGLGWIDGNVRKFDESKLITFPKIPHMGWNSVNVKSAYNLFKGVDVNRGFYFIHSYYIDLHNDNDIMTTSNYVTEFVSGINKSNIYGVQFHPEKSHSNGMKLLENFSKL